MCASCLIALPTLRVQFNELLHLFANTMWPACNVSNTRHTDVVVWAYRMEQAQADAECSAPGELRKR